MPSPVAVRRPELRPAPALAGRSPAEVRALLMQEARGSKLTPLETQYVVGRSGAKMGSGMHASRDLRSQTTAKRSVLASRSF